MFRPNRWKKYKLLKKNGNSEEVVARETKNNVIKQSIKPKKLRRIYNLIMRL